MFLDYIKLAGLADSLEDRETLQKDLYKLGDWATTKSMKFNESEYQILHFYWGNLSYMYRN